jgi:tRNA uridine 5-carbamoylmethylation protein Kti12
MIQNLIIFCGSPASGKTTLSKKITKEQNAIRLSFDELGCFQHKELIPLIIQALQSNNSVVVDALFTRISQRKLILDATKDINCRHILIHMNTPLEECIRRNAQRPNPLPDFMVRDIYNSIELPTLDEGWDEIWYYK